MKIDRVVITTFPGYFFITVLCLRSVKKYLSHLPINIIIDDFDLAHWPTYVSDCHHYLSTEFPDCNFNFKLFSQLPKVDDARHGGWFRQQLIKLHLDQLVEDNNWLIVDADVIFREEPRFNTIPAVIHKTATPIDLGNRIYVKSMLNIPDPYLGPETEYWCASGVPFRQLSKDLLTKLRQHVETVHNKNFLELHNSLMTGNEIVAFDPAGQSMVMSEFQLIEVFRNRCYEKLPVQPGTSKFEHDSVKDWRRDRAWFERQQVKVTDQLWQQSQLFGRHHV